MFSYTKILKDAYNITVKNPVLWFFGLFLFGGFSFIFLNFYDFSLKRFQNQATLGDVVNYLGSHPGTLIGLIVVFLLFAAGVLLITNWSRVMLVLAVQSILETKSTELVKQIKSSRQPLWPVIKVSLITSAITIIAGIGFLLAPFWWIANVVYQSTLWTVGLVVFIPMAFTISCINIFTSFFVIVFKQGVGKALNLGTDFFIVNWSKILGISVVLMVIYSVSFISGIAIIYLVKLAVQFTLETLNQAGAMATPSIISLSQSISAVLVWVLFAGLNVFFNTALLLLFFQLTTQVKSDEEEEKKILISPAASA